MKERHFNKTGRMIIYHKTGILEMYSVGRWVGG